jgi:hypothetical protein
MAKTKTAPTEDTPLVFDLTLNDTTLAGMVKRRAAEAKAHWNKLYDLEKTRTNNRRFASAETEIKKTRDERYQNVYSDNIVFKAKRTVLSFITGRVTAPEVTPSGPNDLAQQFAQDFEKVLLRVGSDTNDKMKIKLALSDLLDGQRVGVLKWVFNDQKQKLELVYCDPDSIVIGSRSGYMDEPDFVQHTQKRTIAKLIQQFPDKEQVIKRLYGIDKGVPSQLEVEKEITENWIFVEDEETIKLAVIFMAGDKLLGKMSDPNWRDDGENLIEDHMVPFVFYNFLNDGKGWIDNTSFLEQARYNQTQYNKRGESIAENAEYAGIGVPVFAGGAIKEETASRVKFNPTQRIILDAEATNVSQAFTTWKADVMPQYVFEDKQKLEQSIYDTFGTNAIQSGQESDQKTLGQDVLLRNQAEGRQQELIDAIDAAMSRYYQLEAQLIYRYYDKPQFFNMLGEDGSFEQLVISQSKIAENIGARISVKSGTNMPVDRSQKMAIAKELMGANKIGTLRLYKEFGIEDPDQAYKEYLQELADPAGALGNASKAIQSREAEEDLQLVIGGRKPVDREDIDEDYIGYLNEYLLTQKYEQLNPKQQSDVNAFIADVIAQAQAKSLKLETQMPLPPPAQPPMPAVGPDGQPLPPDMQQPPQDGTMQPQAPGMAPAAPPAAEPMPMQ